MEEKGKCVHSLSTIRVNYKASCLSACPNDSNGEDCGGNFWGKKDEVDLKVILKSV
jgi:hypothetical protein